MEQGLRRSAPRDQRNAVVAVALEIHMNTPAQHIETMSKPVNVTIKGTHRLAL